MIKFLFSTTAVFISLLFLFASHCSASLIINEIFPSPLAGSGEAEWLEILNISEREVSLENWYVARNVGLGTERRDSLSDLGVLDTGEFLVFETVRVALPNNGSTVFLLYGDEIVDVVTYPSINNRSFARIVDGGSVWEITTPTKGFSNNRVSGGNDDSETTGYFHNFRVNEIYSCSLAGEMEWLELENNTGTTVSLQGWRLRNQNNTSRVVGDFTLRPNGLTVIEFASGLLTNGGGSVSLFDPDNNLVWTETFPGCSVNGTSFIRINGTWQETSQVTKGLPNPTSIAGSNNTGNSGTSSNAQSRTSEYEGDDGGSNDSNPSTATSSPVGSSARNSYQLPNYHIRRLISVNEATGSAGQVLGATTNIPSAPLTSNLSFHIGFMLIGGTIISLGGIGYYFYVVRRTNKQDESF
ncbi:MAG: lamin tail domain-containing protein [Pseudomonadales bacterium]|jgi:hypothetical protein|nr:lamin tail domain-containing protein [Pseudomonadales bacterium]